MHRLIILELFFAIKLIPSESLFIYTPMRPMLYKYLILTHENHIKFTFSKPNCFACLFFVFFFCLFFAVMMWYSISLTGKTRIVITGDDLRAGRQNNQILSEVEIPYLQTCSANYPPKGQCQTRALLNPRGISLGVLFASERPRFLDWLICNKCWKENITQPRVTKLVNAMETGWQTGVVD